MMETHLHGPSNVEYYEALASVYDLFFQDMDNATDTEVAWLDVLLTTYGASSVLDAGCGNGRHAARLAARGYTVTGADPSNAMLRQAAAMAKRHRVTFPLLCATFEDLPACVGRKFDVVVSFGNSLCNIESRNAVKSALAALRECCRQGGTCLIGIKDFDRIRVDRPQFLGHKRADRDGVRTILFESWDYADPTLVITAYLIQGTLPSGEWRTTSATTREYMLGCHELRELALDIGFASVSRVTHPSEAAYALRV